MTDDRPIEDRARNLRNHLECKRTQLAQAYPGERSRIQVQIDALVARVAEIEATARATASQARTD